MDSGTGGEHAAAKAGDKPLWLKAAPFIFLMLWSSGFACAKIGLQYSPPMTFLALRYALVLVMLAPLAILLRPPLPKRGIDYLHVAITGFLVQGVYFGFSYFAFWLGASAGSVALIVSLQPILVGLLAPRFAGEHVGWTRWTGLILGLAGAAIVIVARSEIEVTTAAAMICAVAALAGMTGGTLYEKRFGVSQHPVTANAIQYVVGLLFVLPLALASEDMRVDWTWQLIVTVLYLAVANSLISMTLLLAMIRAGEASRVSALFFMVPPMAAVIAWVLLGEAMPPVAWAGMAIAAAGVLIATRNWPAGGRQRPAR
jgi:drug/metabolite transporter (DMT)-like permease